MRSELFHISEAGWSAETTARIVSEAAAAAKCAAAAGAANAALTELLDVVVTKLNTAGVDVAGSPARAGLLQAVVEAGCSPVLSMLQGEACESAEVVGYIRFVAVQRNASFSWRNASFSLSFARVSIF